MAEQFLDFIAHCQYLQNSPLDLLQEGQSERDGGSAGERILSTTTSAPLSCKFSLVYENLELKEEESESHEPEVEVIPQDSSDEDPDVVFVKTNVSSPEALVKILTGFQDFSTSLENLCESADLTATSVKCLIEKYSHIFSFQNNAIGLKIKLRVCKKHCHSQGCKDRELCSDLHICNEFVRDKCQNPTCIYGHRWNTGHNNTILKKHSLENLSSEYLQKIVHSFGSGHLSQKSIGICHNYNGSGCSVNDCQLIHICYSFFVHLLNSGSKCTETCPLSHDLQNSSCERVLRSHKLPVNETPRDIALAMVSANPSLISEDRRRFKRKKLSHQSIWAHDLSGNVATQEICYKSVVSKCPMEESSCQRLHSSLHFHWQISEDGNHWLNLRTKQVKCLERAYCNPGIDSVELPRLDPSTLELSLKDLFLIVGRDIWIADFYSFSLENSQKSKKLMLRRLCTESVSNVQIPIKPSNFLWYFLDANNSWVPYGDDSTADPNLKINMTSAIIEGHYVTNPSGSIIFCNAKFSYLLDFQQMCQQNQQTRKIRQVKRRPEPHLQEDGMEDLPEDWKVVFPVQRVQRVRLEEDSSQYKEVIKLLNRQRTFQSRVFRIERIQNLYLWKAYQNKKSEMINIYGNYSDVNEQYLFHGTSPDHVSNICNENFDWRLHGSSNGQAYGRGTYFSADPHYSATYTRPDPFNHRFLFVALVAVGKAVLGNHSMIRPPGNPATNLPFDSTTGPPPNSHIVVKYDKQEYYPQFLVTYI